MGLNKKSVDDINVKGLKNKAPIAFCKNVLISKLLK